MMLEDGDRWRMMGAMLGVAFLTSLNVLERAGLLSQNSPIKDLGLGIALMGRFTLECASLCSEVPVPEEWDRAAEVRPNVLVRYARDAGVKVEGVHGIEKDFVEKYPAEGLERWKAKAGVDWWRWKTKYRQFTKSYGPKLGGSQFDIFKITAGQRKSASYDRGQDPLDPKHRKGMCKAFEEAEKNLKKQEEKVAAMTK